METNNMAIIGNIDGVPVFDKKEEALTWGRQRGLTGYHTHDMNGVTGYMGGSDHAEATSSTTNTSTTTTSTTNTSTTTTSGY